jgi:hypothetical protein
MIREMLTDSKFLQESGHSKHRWYTTFQAVVKIEDIFIKFTTYSNSGDDPALDNDEWTQMVLSSMKQVYPKEIAVIDYQEI